MERELAAFAFVASYGRVAHFGNSCGGRCLNKLLEVNIQVHGVQAWAPQGVSKAVRLVCVDVLLRYCYDFGYMRATT